MSTEENAKLARKRWDREHLKTAACRLKVDEYEAFQKYCEAQGKTVSAVLLEYVRSCIK